jgi:hypothetical protein
LLRFASLTSIRRSLKTRRRFEAGETPIRNTLLPGEIVGRLLKTIEYHLSTLDSPTFTRLYEDIMVLTGSNVRYA